MPDRAIAAIGFTARFSCDVRLLPAKASTPAAAHGWRRRGLRRTSLTARCRSPCRPCARKVHPATGRAGRIAGVVGRALAGAAAGGIGASRRKAGGRGQPSRRDQNFGARGLPWGKQADQRGLQFGHGCPDAFELLAQQVYFLFQFHCGAFRACVDDAAPQKGPAG